MKLSKLKLITIICEPVLEKKMTALIKRYGAKGYSISEIEGEGESGVRAADVSGRDLRIETIVSPEVAEQILQNLNEHYFNKYSVLAFLIDCEVVRAGKYS